MADSVIPFPAVEHPPEKPRGRKLWICGCGSREWNLMADGAVECAVCDAESITVGWYFYDPGDGAA